jgi:ABC-type nitrate/sulfonate/bicarbonate transport system substrate-binding protein
VNASARTEMSIGFIPLLDCALLVVAQEVGMARQQGLTLRLLRESSWANIRDRVAIGHFDAAHMLAPMVVAESVGAGHLDTPFMTPMVLSSGGNAITVSRALWEAMQEAGAAINAQPAVQAQALAQVVARRAAAGQPQLTLAMVFPFSCHHYQLRDWLQSGGVDADRDVRLVVLPPPLLVDALRSGQVDGFCVGEPWNSLAVDTGIGVIAAVCSDIWPQRPEKVLGMRARFAEEKPEVVAALVRALQGASRWVSDAANHQDLARLLGQPRYVGAPARLLQAALGGSIRASLGHDALLRPEFLRLGGPASVPREEDARLLLGKMEHCGQVVPDEAARARAVRSFRGDLFAAATGQGL